MKTIKEIIYSYDVLSSEKENVYLDQVLNASQANCNSKKEWNEYCLPYEYEFMEAEFGHVDKARKNNGGWFINGENPETGKRFIGDAYASAKSTIGTALDHGIPLVDEKGVPVGKSALADKIKEAKSEGKEEKSAVEKVQVMLESIAKVYAKGSHGDQVDISRAIHDLYNKL